MNKNALRAKVTLVLGVLLALGTSVEGQNQDFSKVQIKVTKVSGNIYMLEGQGGNIAASVGEDGSPRRSHWWQRTVCEYRVNGDRAG